MKCLDARPSVYHMWPHIRCMRTCTPLHKGLWLHVQDKRRTLEALESRMSSSRNEVAAAEARVSAAEAAVSKRETQVAAEAAAAVDKAAEAER